MAKYYVKNYKSGEEFKRNRVVLSVTIAEDLNAQIEMIAKESNEPKSQIVERMLRIGLVQYKKEISREKEIDVQLDEKKTNAVLNFILNSDQPQYYHLIKNAYDSQL